jgi:hypothetical protein
MSSIHFPKKPVKLSNRDAPESKFRLAMNQHMDSAKLLGEVFAKRENWFIS